MKFSDISKAAAAVVLGSLVFTGCSGSGSCGAASADIAVAASVVDGISTNGLTLTFEGGSTCFNNKDLNTTGNAFTISDLDLNASATEACANSLADEFDISVNPILAKAGNVQLSDKIGTEPLRGKKNKQVNIFSTIAVATGQEVVDVDVNDDSKPAIKALKSYIQLKLVTGSRLNTMFSSPSALNLGDLESVTDEIPEGVIGSDAIDKGELNTIVALFKENAEVNDISDIEDNKLPETIKVLQTQAEEVAKGNPQISVTSLVLKLDDSAWTASKNEFEITDDVPEIDASDSDITFGMNAAGLNNFTASDVTLKAIIANENETELEITLTGISIAANAASATVKSGAILTVDSASASISSGSVTTTNDITSTDLTFSVRSILNATSTDETAVQAAIEDTLAALKAGTYTVTVGLSGLGDTSNLNDVSSTLGTGYKGYTGSVTLEQ